MEFLCLINPFVFLLAQDAIRFFLLTDFKKKLLDQETPGYPQHLLKALDIKWSKGLLHSLKDWLVLGALGTVAIRGLMGHVPWVFPALMAMLALLLFIRSFTLSVLWLHAAGVRVPGFFLNRVVGYALPISEPGSRKRVLFWSGAFLLTGCASLWGWSFCRNLSSLFWGFFTLILGFISLLRAITYTSQSLGAKKNAEEVN